MSTNTENNTKGTPGQSEQLERRKLVKPFKVAAQPYEWFCRVVRVNECAAVVTMTPRRREFTTRFDKHVRLQPSPILFRISPKAGVQILNRKSP